MADSETSTSLATVTRRDLLAIPLVVSARRQLTDPMMASQSRSTDPASLLWLEWLAAHRQTERLCHRQQRLERRLIEEAGFPHLVSSDAELELLFVDESQSPADLARAQTELTERQERWDAADQRIGYSAAKRDEEEAANCERELFDALCSTPARTVAGVAAKLDAILREGEWCEDCPEFPWPQIRAALKDLVAMAKPPDSADT